MQPLFRMNLLSVALLAWVSACLAVSPTLPAIDRDACFSATTLRALGYEPLFDGESLDGWYNPYGHGEARVVDEEIHLTADKKFFLVTKEEYADFRLVAEIHLPEGPANSGIMFRCHAEPNRVFGYQAECDGSDRRWSGGLYDEGRRGWVWPSKSGRSEAEFLTYEESSQEFFRQPEVRDTLRRDGWNRFEIMCRGERIQVWVNGVLVTDLRDTLDSSGPIAIQHHGEKGQTYRFKNLFVKKLPVVPARETVRIVEQPPESIERLTDGTVLVDFGRVAFGNLQVTPPAGSESSLKVRFGEALTDGRVETNPPGTVRFSEVVVSATPGEPIIVAPPADERNTDQLVPSQSHAMAVLTPADWGVVTPFRWVEIEGMPNAESSAVVRCAAMPVEWDEDAATFECSDERLNRLWELCQYSIKATAFAGVYVDGDRERIPYEADAYINQLSHLYVEGGAELGRETFDWLIEHPTWPTEWPPHMVLMAHADWLHTGDAEWLAPRYELLKPKLLAERVGESGLVESTQEQIRRGDIVDWPPKERDGFVRTPCNSVVNAFHFASVQCMAELAEAVGKSDEARAYSDYASGFRERFNAAFFDADRGVYVDGLDTDHSSAHANFFTLAFGLVPEEHRESIASRLADQGMRCSVYAAQYLLEALYENGADQGATALMTAPGKRSWNHMLDSDATITWEAWDAAFKPNLDWNHAWGAAPGNLLPRYVLGVQPRSAGWSSASIRPMASGLSKAAGRTPTPFGPIDVEWTDGDRFRLTVDAPPQVALRVAVPTRAGDFVEIDGIRVAATRDRAHWLIDNDLRGRHTIEVSSADNVAAETTRSEAVVNEP